MDALIDRILHLPTWLAVVAVFALPAAEASVFLGFLFPGEIAVIIGGVLAFQGRVPLEVVIIAAVLGAIIGDGVGYVVGRRWGRRMLDGTIGRFVDAAHLDRAESFLASHGGKAVFFGRWTAALRALIPGLAGMSRMPYRTFGMWNALGGALWAITFVLLGDLAGNGWRHIQQRAHEAGLIATAAVLAVGVGIVAVRRRRARARPPEAS